MELSQLRTLINVAELGSLSKASDQLHIAQPALSRQVRMLEEELGFRLFDRHGRGMKLTEEGQDVLLHARRIMIELDEIRMVSAGPNAPLRGHVSIGMPPTVSDILSVPLVAAFSSRHPEATLRVVSAYSGFLLDWLHRGQVDAAVLYNPGTAKSLRLDPLLEETLYLVEGAATSTRPAEPVSFADIVECRLLLPSPGHGLRDVVERYARDLGLELSVKAEADSFSTLRNLVIGGHGSTILPLAAIHDDLAAGRLTSCEITDPTPKRKLILAFPTDRPQSRLATFAGEVISQTIANLVTEGIWAGRLLDALEDLR